MADEPSPTRERLLEATLAYVSEHGVADLGFREVARALGTTHRLLGYHFGSKEGLLVEVVRAVEHDQRQALAEVAADDDLGPVEQMRRLADRLTDAALWPNERLFFELYGQALQGRGPATDLLPEAVTDWIEPLAHLSERLGVAPEDVPAHAHLLIAVARGLLLDLLATNDRDTVLAAAELFFRYMTQASGEEPD